MKTKSILLVAILVLSVTWAAFGDRQLDRTEILQILQQLTAQPKKTWIPAGTIEATHEEYKAPETTDTSEINSHINQKIAEYQNNLNKQELTENLQKMKLDAIPFNVRYKLSNEYTMNSAVTIKYDGNRFYWEIDVESRTDSITPSANLAGNYMTDQFNLDWNAKRIFAWDGVEYTTYFLPGNRASVDSTGKTPHIVGGILTAGVIPWGYGYYSYDNLAATDSAAVEKIIDSQTQIHLTVNNADDSRMVFIMDPAKNYAVLSCSVDGPGEFVISKQYSDYQLISGNWVPATILLERFEAETNRLLAHDLWNITSINTTTPGIESFEIDYEPEALIEYCSVITRKPAMYYYSAMADTDNLLAERLVYAANEDGQPQNCATAALKYAIGQLGKSANDQQLAGLVTDNGTDLLVMKQFAQNAGLYCRAVTTDIDTLKSLQDCQVILHIPGKKHYVVVESIDNDFVRIIDLANDKFYYRTDINFFDMDWTEGTALLISNEIISGDLAEISDTELANITGATGYTCTLLLQEYNVEFCIYIDGGCDGSYVEYYERWGCESAESGSCSMTWMMRLRTAPCIEDPYDPFNCTITGNWTVYYMRACD